VVLPQTAKEEKTDRKEEGIKMGDKGVEGENKGKGKGTGEGREQGWKGRKEREAGFRNGTVKVDCVFYKCYNCLPSPAVLHFPSSTRHVAL
jgi:hypothetical protein